MCRLNQAIDEKMSCSVIYDSNMIRFIRSP